MADGRRVALDPLATAQTLARNFSLVTYRARLAIDVAAASLGALEQIIAALRGGWQPSEAELDALSANVPRLRALLQNGRRDCERAEVHAALLEGRLGRRVDG